MTSGSTPIFLVGFMGSGKSVVGPELANLLGRTFVDLDVEIVLVANQSIPEVIAAKGESEFRRLESECLGRLAAQPDLVIATGGGVVLDSRNRELMKASGFTVWLDAPFELCWKRIESDRTIRPLAPDRATALSRFNDRFQFYKESELGVDIDETMTASFVAQIIADRIQGRSQDG